MTRDVLSCLFGGGGSLRCIRHVRESRDTVSQNTAISYSWSIISGSLSSKMMPLVKLVVITTEPSLPRSGVGENLLPLEHSGALKPTQIHQVKSRTADSHPPTARNPCRPINTDPSHKRKVPHSLPLHCNGGCRGEQREHREGVPKGECSRTAQPRRQNKGGGCSALLLDSFLFSQSCFAFLLPCF